MPKKDFYATNCMTFKLQEHPYINSNSLHLDASGRLIRGRSLLCENNKTLTELKIKLTAHFICCFPDHFYISI